MTQPCLYCGDTARKTRWRICGACDDARRPIQWAAYMALRGAIRRGEIQPARGQTCVDCGQPAMDHDHRDYRRPLEVQPVCRRCNIKRGPAEFRCAA